MHCTCTLVCLTGQPDRKAKQGDGYGSDGDNGPDDEPGPKRSRFGGENKMHSAEHAWTFLVSPEHAATDKMERCPDTAEQLEDKAARLGEICQGYLNETGLDNSVKAELPGLSVCKFFFPNHCIFVVSKGGARKHRGALSM